MKLKFKLMTFLLPMMLGPLHSSNVAAQTPTSELRFGSVAMDIPAVMHRRLTPLIKYLSETLSMPVSLKLSPNMPSAVGEVATGGVELAYLTPVAYINAYEKGKVSLVVKTITEGHPAFQLMIVVHKDSPIRTIDDLAGKTFAFGDKAAILQRAIVVNAGMPLEKLSSYKFIGHYDNIAQGVLSGDFAAGIVKDTTAVAWEKKGLRVLYSSPELPPYNISAKADMDGVLLEKIRRAFLALDPKKPQHQEIISALDPSYTGFAATSDAEYDIVRKLIAPFKGEK